MLEIIGLILFFAVLGLGLLLILFGLPGCWIIVADALAYYLLRPDGPLTGRTLGILLGLALAAEGLEFLAVTYGARRFGASRRGMIAGIVGAILGAVLFSPLLFLGGAILGAFFGTFIGAFLAEYFAEHDRRKAFRSGMAAVFGKLSGVLIKIAAAVIMIALILAAWLWPAAG